MFLSLLLLFFFFACLKLVIICTICKLAVQITHNTSILVYVQYMYMLVYECVQYIVCVAGISLCMYE